MKIVIAEDEDLVFNLYKRLLEAESYEIVRAIDGEQAILVVNQEKPDLLLLDIMLPNKDGLEVLKQLRETHTKEKLPIIVLTNLATEQIFNETFKYGISSYLIKSETNNKTLIQTIKSVINKSA